MTPCSSNIWFEKLNVMKKIALFWNLKKSHQEFLKIEWESKLIEKFDIWECDWELQWSGFERASQNQVRSMLHLQKPIIYLFNFEQKLTPLASIHTQKMSANW
jgi:hypothetical protein